VASAACRMKQGMQSVEVFILCNPSGIPGFDRAADCGR
jgi:hypothetical protein